MPKFHFGTPLNCQPENEGCHKSDNKIIFFVLTYLFYIPDLLLLLSGLWVFFLHPSDRKFSLALVQALLCLPLLAAEYLYLASHLRPQVIPLILLSESIFALTWWNTAHWMYHAVAENSSESKRFSILGIFIGSALLGIAAYSFLSGRNTTMPGRGFIVFPQYGIYFFSIIFLLLSIVVMAWHLEYFWRSMSAKQRWEYKFLMLGGCLICGTQGWSASYRLTYLRLDSDHFMLLSTLLVFGWLLMVYAVARHRLLNRKIFVSRKVVYSFIPPLVFGLYLIALGLIILFMRLFQLTLPYVLKWLLFVAGLVAIMSMVFSGKVRHRVKFFISTNFYNNKYEYRDEWLAFSRLLRGSLTETEVVNALDKVLTESLYTNIVFIWLGNDKKGYRIALSKGIRPDKEKTYNLAPDDPLIYYLKKHNHYYIKEKGGEQVPPEKKIFFSEIDLVLAVPLTIGEQMIGLIALGPEFTGGRYGQDDFDLLTALGTQAASALLAARTAEELSRARQQEAWDIMSAFILHDVKNAASMLSLARQNAPAHLHDPEFQLDMLDTIDDSLKRMAKVQDRLSALKGEIMPVWKEVCLCRTLSAGCQKLAKKLHGLQVNIQCDEPCKIKTDTELLLRILENLLLNSLEAHAKEITVEITKLHHGDLKVLIELTDNGPGLPEKLLPDAIFEPFKTTKPKGSGIGLWQVRQIVTSLGGAIMAVNSESGGAHFIVTLPVNI